MNGSIELPADFAPAGPRHPAALAAEDVRSLYWILLGREAETEAVVEGKLGLPDIAACVADFVSSAEFEEAVVLPVVRGGWFGGDGLRRVDAQAQAWLAAQAGSELSAPSATWAHVLVVLLADRVARETVAPLIADAARARFFDAIDQRRAALREGHILLQPALLHNLRHVQADDIHFYVADSSDPQMLLVDGASGSTPRLEPGAYELQVRLVLAQGAISRPAIYLDFGAGLSEEAPHKHLLRKAQEDGWRVRFQIDAPVHTLRFDPSEVACAFTDVSLALRPVDPQAYAAEAPAGPADGPHHAAYMRQVARAQGARPPWYAPLRSAAPAPLDPDLQILAFYLPQFHPFKENDEWWGRGFTEWTNVGKAVPQFAGHDQPRLPGELGYYDLRNPEVMVRQVELARLYGLTGFCFHYYWFGGKRLLEKPLETYLADRGRTLDLPFCLCWANENWTRRWDGAEHSVLMAQQHGAEDNARVFEDLLRFLVDPRYIRADGRPVIVIYRPGIIPDVAQMVAQWRRMAVAAGLPGLFIIATNSFGFEQAEAYGFDGVCEFPPHNVVAADVSEDTPFLNPDFAGAIYDYGEVVDHSLARLAAKTPGAAAYLPGVMAAWDNEARKPGRGNVFKDARPEAFSRWLTGAGEWLLERERPGRRMMFVNAWNEWGEGTYLEPDRDNGYAYLSAVAAFREEHAPDAHVIEDLARTIRRAPSSDAALYLHLFYPEMLEEVQAHLAALRTGMDIDVLVTVPRTWTVEQVGRADEALRPVRMLAVENRGRDVWPFLQTLSLGRELGYTLGCKVHSKKSSHLGEGEAWRRGLFGGLLDPALAGEALALLRARPEVGLAAPRDSLFPAADAAAMRDNRATVAKLLRRAGAEAAPLQDFVAGTMFWFKGEALARVLDLGLDRDDFGPELGAIDGTLAHALERLFPTLAALAGFETATYASAGVASPYAATV